MLDNALYIALKAAIDAGLAAAQIDAVSEQKDQPTTQGDETGAAVYFTKLPMDKRYGWPEKSDVWNDDHTLFTHTERQRLESTVQISARKREDPASLDELTAGDIANAVAFFVQSDAGLALLAGSGLRVLRIGQVRGGHITNGEGQFETVPSFDLVLLHEQVTVTTTPAAVVKDFRIDRV
jgi:hypothetical protein